MSSLDLQDAYYLVSIHESSRKFLRFLFEDQLYEFTCLPFGLSTAPYVFTKLTKPVAAYLRKLGFQSVVYLDDWLLFGKSFADCQRNVLETRALLSFLGFIFNDNKSALDPSHRCKFLGFIYDSLRMTVELTEEKILKIKSSLEKVHTDNYISIRKFAEVLGFLVSCCPAVNYGLMHTKASERQKYLALRYNNDNYNAKMLISERLRRELKWWTSRSFVPKQPIRHNSFVLEIFTDASLSGWGAFSNGKRVFGHWKEIEKTHNINYLELLAAFFGLKIFAKDYSNCQILLRIDNTTAIAYINKMGGVQFKNLNKISHDIWSWCEDRQIWIFATYIASKDNVEADFESRREKSVAEIELSIKAFNHIVDKFGKPQVDLFATRANAKCRRYVSWKRDPGCFATDAFTLNWASFFFYAFPPCSVILKCLQKIRDEKAEGIMVVPEWPAQPWYPLFYELLISKTLKIKAKDNIFFPNRETDHFWNKTILVVAILSGKPTS